MQTQTTTYTNVDIRRVTECFAADLAMLASRTGAMTLEKAHDTAHDVALMAVHRCLASAHIQLRNAYNQLEAAHKYTVREESGQLAGARPGGNDWPRMPGGSLAVLVSYSDVERGRQLESSGRLLLPWGPSDIDDDYDKNMSPVPGRQYASNGYGWDRSSYVSMQGRAG